MTYGALAATFLAEGQKRNRYSTQYPISCLPNPSRSPPTRPTMPRVPLRHFEPLSTTVGGGCASWASQRVASALRHRFRFPACRLLSQRADGGENSPGARINLNSGVLNPKRLASRFGPEASELWEKGRLRDRIDAVIVHEDIEGLKVVEN